LPAFGAKTLRRVAPSSIVTLSQRQPLGNIPETVRGVFADRQAGRAGIKACRPCRPIGKNICQKPRGALIRNIGEMIELRLERLHDSELGVYVPLGRSGRRPFDHAQGSRDARQKSARHRAQGEPFSRNFIPIILCDH
jgi:hypothetical protein